MFWYTEHAGNLSFDPVHVLYCLLSHLGHGGDFSACVL